MKSLRVTIPILCCLISCGFLVFGALPALAAVELNEDGKALILEAAKAYRSDMRDRPVVTDREMLNYIERITLALIPKEKSPPPGVNLNITILDSPKPELYAYVDGNLVTTNGMIFSMENEAQLAGAIAPQVAHLVEGYYLLMYQEIKAAERRQRRKAAAGALFGALLDVAVDYTVEVESIKQTERYYSGEQTYRETMKRMAAGTAARSAYYGIKDVIAGIPAKDDQGHYVDPRQRFQPVADAQGMEYMALAGYETAEAAKSWENVHAVNNKMAREQEQALGPYASQMRAMQGLMELNMQRMQQSLGASGLVQTVSDVPAGRAPFVAQLTNLQEVQTARQTHTPQVKKAEYLAFLQKVLGPRAQKALAEERYSQAAVDFQILHDRGLSNAPVLYGLAKSKLGDFAFGASEAEKEKAEKLYREAAARDPKYALPHKGLGELYEDSERYGEAAKAYERYLQLAPQAKDRSRIENKIKTMKRKAGR